MNLTNEMQSRESFIDLLERRVGEQKIKLSDLANKTSLSYSSVNRGFNRKKKFNILESIEILNVLFSREDALNIIKQYYPQADPVLNLLKDIKSDSQISSDQEMYLSNPKTFAITNLIELGYLKTTKEVKEMFGTEGKSLLTKLALTGMVVISKDGNIKSQLYRAKPSFETIRSQISNATAYHKDSNCGKFKNFIYFGTQLISKEKRVKIYKITRLFKELMSSLIHEDSIDSKKLDQLNEEFKTYEKSNTKKTEPIYYSMMFDDFHNTEYNNEVLQ